MRAWGVRGTVPDLYLPSSQRSRTPSRVSLAFLTHAFLHEQFIATAVTAVWVLVLKAAPTAQVAPVDEGGHSLEYGVE
eukprot:scaffold8177_cov484-Prasinococcus_capsulatus_cf.AAC.2